MSNIVCQVALLPSYNSEATGSEQIKFVLRSVYYALFLQQSVKQQIVLFYQVALLPSNNGLCSSG